MYIFISGEVKDNRFIYNLPRRIEGSYNIAITECIIFSKFNAPFFLTLDICNESIVNGDVVPILRRINTKIAEYNNPYFMKIVPNSFSKLEFSFLDKRLEYIDAVNFACTLWLTAS